MMKVRACHSGYNVSVWVDNAVCPSIEHPTVSLINNNKVLTYSTDLFTLYANTQLQYLKDDTTVENRRYIHYTDKTLS